MMYSKHALRLHRKSNTKCGLSDSRASLIRAVRQGNVTKVNKLLSNSKITDHFKLGDSGVLLQAAVYANNFQMLETLLTHQDKKIFFTTDELSSLLWIAMRHKLRAIAMLLIRAGADVNNGLFTFYDGYGNEFQITYLQEAIRTQDRKMVGLLLDFGARLNACDTTCENVSTMIHDAGASTLDNLYFVFYVLIIILMLNMTIFIVQ